MTVTWQTLVTAAAIIAAAVAIIGYLKKAFNWFAVQEDQTNDIAELKQKEAKDISDIKREQTMIVYALSACLDGLVQLGANHTVPVARDKLDKYINQQAHDQL